MKTDLIAHLKTQRSYSFVHSVLLLAGTSSLANAQVELTGLDDALRNNALIHMSLDDELCDAPAWRIEDQFSLAEDEIQTSLEALGYYAVEITSSLSIDDTCWAATFDVLAGEPVTLRNVDITIADAANNDVEFSRVIDLSNLHSGQVLHHGHYTALKNRLLDLSLERGYMEAAYAAAKIDVYPSENAADVALRLDSGPRYTYGEIQIEQDTLDRDLLARYYDFAPGDPYDRNDINRLYQALLGSGYFDGIDVRPLAEDANSKTVPILIRLTPSAQRSSTYGVGFSTNTGPRIRAGATNRRLNTRGAQIGVNGQLSPVISEVLVNYRLPYGDPRSEWVSFDAGIKHEDTDTAVSDSIEFGVRRVISRPRGWLETQFINSLVENFEVGTEKSRSRLLTPGASWLKVSADDALRPANGYRLGIEISAASDAIGSDTSFIQLVVDGKWIHSFSNDSRLLVRGRFGASWEDNFIELPPSVRFFAGGDNSIRGYKFESLGPLDSTGNVIGGNRLTVASIEYEYPVNDRWSVAVFADSGNAYRSGNFSAKSGIGAGLRWQSPLGPIRFDIAFPRDGDDRSARLHISLGADL
jgi:translocation and assembly module TamA